MRKIRNSYSILVRKREWCRWDNNIKVDVKEIVWEGVDWFHLAQTRDWWRAFVNTVMNLRIP
jgi:hypothetical protein